MNLLNMYPSPAGFQERRIPENDFWVHPAQIMYASMGLIMGLIELSIHNKTYFSSVSNETIHFQK